MAPWTHPGWSPSTFPLQQRRATRTHGRTLSNTFYRATGEGGAQTLRPERPRAAELPARGYGKCVTRTKAQNQRISPHHYQHTQKHTRRNTQKDGFTWNSNPRRKPSGNATPSRHGDIAAAAAGRREGPVQQQDTVHRAWGPTTSPCRHSARPRAT